MNQEEIFSQKDTSTWLEGKIIIDKNIRDLDFRPTIVIDLEKLMKDGITVD